MRNIGEVPQQKAVRLAGDTDIGFQYTIEDGRAKLSRSSQKNYIRLKMSVKLSMLMSYSTSSSSSELMFNLSKE